MFPVASISPRTCVMVMGALLLVWMTSGCAASQRGAPDVTGGVSLRLRMNDARGGAAVLYDVSQDGTLGFAGGMDATFDRITWTGALTADEIAQLLGHIERDGWFERSPKGAGEPESLTYRINLKGPAGRKQFVVKGANVSVQAVEALLDRAARRRLEPILERLPKPSGRE